MNKLVTKSVERNSANVRFKFLFVVFFGAVLLGLSLFAGTPVKVASFLFAMGGIVILGNVSRQSINYSRRSHDTIQFNDSTTGNSGKSSKLSRKPSQINRSELTADKFMLKQLSDMGMSPQKDGNTIIFQYKGGFFRAQWLDKHIIRISFPCILSVDANHQGQVSRLLNAINSSYVLVKAIMVPSDNDSSLMVHAVADIYYTSLNCSTEGYLTEVLDMLFTVRNTLFEGVDSLERHEELTYNHDDDNYYGFSLN